MKKIVLTALAGAVLGVCNAQQTDYKITGIVDNKEDGMVYLLDAQSAGMGSVIIDTLDTAELKDGKFVMTGTTDETKFVLLVVEGASSGIGILLENADFSAKINTVDGDASVIEGGEMELYGEYKKLGEQIEAERRSLGVKLQQATSQDEAAAIQNEMGGLDRKMQDLEYEFIKAHPDANLCGWIVSRYTGMYTKEFILKMYNALSDKGKATQMGKYVWERYQVRMNTDYDQTMPDFTVNGTDGEPFNMYDRKTGKYKIVLFWTLEDKEQADLQNKTLSELYELYKDKGLEIVSVCGSKDVEAWKKAVWDGKFSWQSGIVTDDTVATMFGLKERFLQIFVLDANNKIVLKGVGGEILKAKVSELFQ